MNRITQKVVDEFSGNLRIGTLWTREQVIKFWKVRVVIRGYG